MARSRVVPRFHDGDPVLVSTVVMARHGEFVPPAPTTMTEAQLKSLCMGLGIENGWLVHATAQAKPRRPIRAKGVGGYPDLTFARGKRVLWFELKDEHGYPTLEQFDWGAAVPAWYLIRPSDWDSGLVHELLA